MLRRIDTPDTLKAPRPRQPSLTPHSHPSPTSHYPSAFNNAWMITLNAKRDKEAEMERTVRTNAAEDMAKWTQQREIRLKAKKETNRSEEQLLLETLESEADPAGNSWERIGKLIPADADAEGKKADVKRMRSLLIELKRDPVVTKN